MFYYAYINENNIVTGVYALPAAITATGYITITEQQYTDSTAGNENSIIGKVYNAETGTFDTLYYYAILNSRSVVTEVVSNTTPIEDAAFIQISSLDSSLIGKYWNGTEFIDPPAYIAAAHSSDDICYKMQDKYLSTKLDEMDTTISGKAASTDLHEHSNKTVLDSITSEMVAAWNSGTGSGSGVAGADGEDGATFTPSVSADGIISWTNDKGLTNPTPVNIKGADGTNGTNGVDGADGTTVVVGTTTTGNAGTDASVTGVLNSETNTLTLNFTIPKGDTGASGTSASITADEVLTKIKTVDGANSGLDADLLDGHNSDYFATAEQLAGKANTDHTHTEYAASNHTHSASDVGAASADHTHTEYAASNHTHTEYAASGHTHSEYASANHTHDGYATTEALAGKAASDHTHSMDDITGLSNAMSGKADSNHTHSGYASSSHTHSEYASTSHTHSDYASSSHTHTSFSSAINVAGAIKSNGVQVGYNSGTDTTLGSNNYPTIVAGTQVTLNGEKTYAPNIYPRNTGSFDLGAQSNRWSNIYSKTALNVSSDRRLKENIEAIDAEEAMKLIKGIDVVNFNYIGNEAAEVGVIAQDILRLSPELAKALVTQGADGYYGVKTSNLVFPLIVAVQKLAKEIENLKK